MLRWDETDGSVSVFRQPALNTQRPHGRPAGPAGDLRAPRPLRLAHRTRRLAHGARRRTTKASASTRRTTWSSRATAAIWFTDPSYGIDSDYEGDASRKRDRRAARLPHRRHERRDHGRGERLRAAQRPGVLARRIAALHRRHRRDACRERPAPRAPLPCVATNGKLTGGEVFATCPVGLYDGLRVDVHGNLWLSAGDGVHCHAAGRHAARQDPDPGDGGQRLLRRRQAEPPVHLRHDARCTRST